MQGLMSSIIYSGNEDASFFVSSRIKNVPKGVILRKWRAHYNPKEFQVDILFGLGFFVIIMFIVLPLMGLQDRDKYFDAIRNNWKWQIIYLAGSLTFCLYSLIKFLFFNTPPWMK